MSKAMLFSTRVPLALADSKEAQLCLDMLSDALLEARDYGFVVTITNEPLTPLAQGHYAPVIELYETKELGMAREAACKAAS